MALKRYLWYTDLILSTLGAYLDDLLGDKFNPIELPPRHEERRGDGQEDVRVDPAQVQAAQRQDQRRHDKPEGLRGAGEGGPRLSQF